MAGKAAVENAVAGKTDYMPGFQCTRDENGYKCEIEAAAAEPGCQHREKGAARLDQRRRQRRKRKVYRVRNAADQRRKRRPQGVLPRFANLKKIKAEA